MHHPVPGTTYTSSLLLAPMPLLFQTILPELYQKQVWGGLQNEYVQNVCCTQFLFSDQFNNDIHRAQI